MRELAIIILNWNGEKDTIDCLKSIYASDVCMSHSIIVYDNCSEQSSYDELKRYISNLNNSLIMEQEEFGNDNTNIDFDIILVRGELNIGFARANNVVMRRVQKEFNYFFLLNNDTVVTSDSIKKMYDYLANNEMASVVTCRINYFEPNDKLWNAGGKFTWYGDRKYFSEKYISGKEIIECEFITGCALMIKSQCMNQVGYFTEKFFFGEEDFNLCKKLKKEKFDVRVLLNTMIYHKVNSSINKMSTGNINKIIIHYLNRIIDQRDLMNNNVQWMIWRVLYLSGLIIKCIVWKLKVKETMYLVNALFEYSNKYDCVGKKEFDYIMGRK